MAYSEEELGKMKRYPLRKAAEEAGLSMSKSSNMKFKEIVEYVLDNQGGSKKSKSKSKAKSERANESEEEPSRSSKRHRVEEPEPKPEPGPEEEPEPSRRSSRGSDSGGDVEHLRSLVEAVGKAQDANHRRSEQIAAVLDRKLNIILAGMGEIGKAVLDEEFDALDKEENFSKNKDYRVKLKAIQEESPFAGGEEEGD